MIQSNHAKPCIFLIDDDSDVLNAYQTLLIMEGYETRCFSDPKQALAALPAQWYGVVVSDIYMPQMSGWELLEAVQKQDPYLPMILITGHGDVPMAIEAVKKGAFYFIEKPIQPALLLQQIEQALAQRRIRLNKREYQQAQLQTHFIGQSQWVKHLRKRLQQLAEIDLPVFIFGETGTGRTMAADYLYELSQERFLHKLNIELIATCELEDLQSKLKDVQSCHLIIKNIEFLTPAAQKYLSQCLYQYKTIRLVAISRHAPQQLLADFGLLPELFYAFRLTQIECLPLAHCSADIEPLFRHYLALICQKLNKKKPLITETLLKKLHAQQWPGNVNQLIQTAELYAVGVDVKSDQVVMFSRESQISLDEQMDEYEKQLIQEVLDRFQGRINNAAQYLQIPRKKLYLRMKKYGLDKGDYRE
ncbi:sigma-54 dependent transcriptional regulator [Pasteurellaceae bacterium LIM206]|nr:sigma-54 dependent transcriptional regulator [Pasteurellaceae bacterium LIM206]